MLPAQGAADCILQEPTSRPSTRPRSGSVGVPSRLPGVVWKGRWGCPNRRLENFARTTPQGELLRRMLLPQPHSVPYCRAKQNHFVVG
jgi:hypothetical protein